MKKTFTLFVAIITSLLIHAQVPELISYQAVVRNSNDQLVVNTAIGMKISILHNSASGTAVYEETQNPTTNANGLVSVKIGNGTVVSGDISSINWSDGTYFIKTQIDITGGTNYNLSATTQILSVPYALYSKTAGNVFSGDYNDLTNQPTILNSQWTTTGNNIYYTEGNVGIGIANPTGELEVLGIIKGINQNGMENSSGQIQSWTNSAAQGLKAVNSFYPTFEGSTDNGARRAADIVSGFNGGAWGNEYLAFHVGSNSIANDKDSITQEMMRITGSGNVGIGIANPTTKLDVAGNINLNNNTITNVADPVNDQDAATKAYVDELRIMILDLQAEVGVTDTRDGIHYKAVRIGNQVWMAENLRYIPSVVGPGTGSQTIPYYYVYGYSGTDVSAAKATANYTTYGVLYNWSAIMAGSTSSSANPSGVQGVCPAGWHIPSDAEWTELTDYLGGTNVAGGKLKESGTTHWISPNTSATNEMDFTALPGGNRQITSSFSGISMYGLWWSATEDDATDAWYRVLYYDYEIVNRYNYYKDYGFSVRCVKD